MEHTELNNIHDVYSTYRFLLENCQRCSANQKVLSHFAYQIDSYALATLLNFYNTNPDIAVNKELWKSNLFMIRMYAIVSCEIIKFLQQNNLINTSAFEKPNSLDDVFAMRNKIHQFRYKDFENNIRNIDLQMGRSRDKLTPRLDICLEYLSDKGGTVLFGTNIYQFHFEEAKDQIAVDLMQRIIRTVERQPLYPPSDFIIRRSASLPQYKWEVYCYTDIVKNTHLKNEKVVDRVLLAFDDLCCISEFFKYVILIDDYLMQAPYMLYFLCKIAAIILDETFDNFKKYIQRSPSDNDGRILNSIIADTNQDFLEFCSTLRNNLHYREQRSLCLGTPEQLYQALNTELSVIETLLERIRLELNIFPSKAKLRFYRFLRWVQMPNN